MAEAHRLQLRALRRRARGSPEHWLSVDMTVPAGG